jgi:DNA-binding SARP family transcriptional activator/Tfp pilus assembly protein PilF/TolB-like protein
VVVDRTLAELNIDLFGSLVVRLDGSKVEGLPRKACALLAYLATHQGEALSREQLADLLWPEKETRLALKGVRNALVAIGKKLGRPNDFIYADARTVELRAAEVDLVRFADLARSANASDLEEAAARYRVELGLDLCSIDSEPFQDWLREERQQMTVLAADALRRLIISYQHVENHTAAIGTALRLVALDPLVEANQRLLMWAYARAGRRGEALRHYQQFVQLLNAELNVTPDPVTVSVAEEIAQLGHSAVPLDTGYRGHLRRDSCPSLMNVLPPSWPLLRPSLSVGFVPIQGFGDRRAVAQKTAALNDNLITDLVRHGHGVLINRVDPIVHAISRISQSIIDYDYVVTGALHATGARHHLNVQVVDGRLGRYCWTQRYSVLADGDITETVARDVHFALIREGCRRTAQAGQDKIRVSDFLENATAGFGQRATLDGTRDAQWWLLRVLAEQPDHGEALTGLARTCQHIVSQPGWADEETTCAAIDVGTKAAEAALSTDPNDSSAHLFLGMLLSSAGKLVEASKEFDSAISLNPDFAAAHAFAGYNNAFLGQIDRTLPAIERAQRLGWSHRRPAVPWFFAGFAHLLLGQHEPAIDLLGKSLDANPDYGSAHLFLSAALWLSGRVEEAETAYDRFRQRFDYYQLTQFDSQWVSRSTAPAYARQIAPIFGAIQAAAAG